MAGALAPRPVGWEQAQTATWWSATAHRRWTSPRRSNAVLEYQMRPTAAALSWLTRRPAYGAMMERTCRGSTMSRSARGEEIARSVPRRALGPSGRKRVAVSGIFSQCERLVPSRTPLSSMALGDRLFPVLTPSESDHLMRILPVSWRMRPWCKTSNLSGFTLSNRLKLVIYFCLPFLYCAHPRR